MIYVGLDVSLNSVAVCAVDETGKLIQEGTTFADAPSIVQYLEPWAGEVERVGLEAGPTSARHADSIRRKRRSVSCWKVHISLMVSSDFARS